MLMFSLLIGAESHKAFNLPDERTLPDYVFKTISGGPILDEPATILQEELPEVPDDPLFIPIDHVVIMNWHLQGANDVLVEPLRRAETRRLPP